MTNWRLTVVFEEWDAFICARWVDNLSLKKLFFPTSCGEPYAMEARSQAVVICSKIRGNGNQEKETSTQHRNHFTRDMLFSPTKQPETVRLFTSTDVFLSNSWFVNRNACSGEPHRLSLSLSISLSEAFLLFSRAWHSLSFRRQVNCSSDRGFEEEKKH